jgi:uncharacterized protein YneF (UPF0154 family)
MLSLIILLVAAGAIGYYIATRRMKKDDAE